jgi:hypothetical protein
MTKSRGIRRSFDEARIEEIRQAYEESDMTIAEIARTMRFAKRKIYEFARERGWKLRERGSHLKRDPEKAKKIRSIPRSLPNFTRSAIGDARERTDAPEVLSAKKILQKAGFVVYGKGPYMVETRWLDRDALLEKAARYGAQ